MEFEFHVREGVIIVEADSQEDAEELVETNLDEIFMAYTLFAAD